ncbi:MAG: ankyrin repeat domain-containing protein [Aestuariivita sp.]|nr:ankyrin repeat domain-containing protein [Aestuariivita sp.]
MAGVVAVNKTRAVHLSDGNTRQFFEVATPDDVQWALDSGKVTNVRNSLGYTPLHFAAHFGSAAAVITLLDAGADIAARCECSMTPLHWAAPMDLKFQLMQNLIRSWAANLTDSFRTNSLLRYGVRNMTLAGIVERNHGL